MAAARRSCDPGQGNRDHRDGHDGRTHPRSQSEINLIVTLEPTFFWTADAPLGHRRGIHAKQAFIENRLVVWRFTDPWRARKPDPFATGLANTLGLGQYQLDDDPRITNPRRDFGGACPDLAQRLNARAGIRVVGDPQTRIRRVALLPGISPLAATMKNLPDADAIVAGETREWESVEYARRRCIGSEEGLDHARTASFRKTPA